MAAILGLLKRFVSLQLVTTRSISTTKTAVGHWVACSAVRIHIYAHMQAGMCTHTDVRTDITQHGHKHTHTLTGKRQKVPVRTLHGILAHTHTQRYTVSYEAAKAVSAACRKKSACPSLRVTCIAAAIFAVMQTVCRSPPIVVRSQQFCEVELTHERQQPAQVKELCSILEVPGNEVFRPQHQCFASIRQPIQVSHALPTENPCRHKGLSSSQHAGTATAAAAY